VGLRPSVRRRRSCSAKSRRYDYEIHPPDGDFRILTTPAPAPLDLSHFAATPLTREQVALVCNSSLHWKAGEMFDKDLIACAGEGGYNLVRDTTCRLFGYHGLMNAEALSLDHMFGF